MAGTAYGYQGGASNLLCMPKDPQYSLRTQRGVQGWSYLHGAEYAHTFGTTHNLNVPCAICSVPRQQALMIPGKTTCPSGWTREYYGYLMSENKATYRSTFTCVDVAQEGLPGSRGHVSASDLYYVEAHCSGLHCPPYDPERELTCVVCTR